MYINVTKISTGPSKQIDPVFSTLTPHDSLSVYIVWRIEDKSPGSGFRPPRRRS